MRSQQGVEKVWGEIKSNVTVLNRTSWKILLIFCFIELPGLNQTFEEKQGYFKLSRARWTKGKEYAT